MRKISVMNVSRHAVHIIFWLAVIFFSSILIQHIISFYSFKTDLEFFQERKRNLDNIVWRLAVYVHVTGGMLCLLSAIPLFIPFVLRHFSYIHNVLGKIYMIAVLGAVVPSGIYISFYSDATVCLGSIAEIRFLILGIALFYTTWKAYVLVKNTEIKKHCDWMIRSYALALVTITFRCMVVMNGALLHMIRTQNVLLSLWASLLFNIIIAEIVIRWKRRFN